MWLHFINLLLFGVDVHSSTSSSSMQQSYLNKQALVKEDISPGRKGRVYFDGSWWPAQCNRALALPPETLVRVIGLHGITLVVEPI